MAEVLKEFLESSTIHGLSYISTAKVGELNLHTFKIGMIIIIRGLILSSSSEYSGKGILVHSSVPWFLGSWFSDQQILFRLAINPCSHLA